MARTLDDLAELSGVSRATVSRVIQWSRSGRDQATSLEVIEGTNYRPNLRAVPGVGTHQCGRCGHACRASCPLRRLLFRRPAPRGERRARRSGERVTLWLGNRSKEETLDRILGTGLMDGVIVTEDNLDDPLVDGLLASDLPTVLIDHRRLNLTCQLCR